MRALFWLTLPLAALLRLLLFPLAWRRRRNAARRGAGWVEVALEGPVEEQRHPGRLPLLFRRLLKKPDAPRVVLSDVRRLIDAVVEDPSVEGLLVRLGPLEGGFAKAATLRELLTRVRAAGKTVVVYAKSHLGNHEALVASGASKLFMTPPATFAAIGASSSGVFLRNVLAHVGVEVEVAAAGRYKSAPERFTRVERSPTDHEQTKALVDEIDRALLLAWQEFRRIGADEAKAQLDAAPLTATQALETTIIDGIVRCDEVVACLPPYLGKGESAPAQRPTPVVSERQDPSGEPGAGSRAVASLSGHIPTEGAPEVASEGGSENGSGRDEDALEPDRAPRAEGPRSRVSAPIPKPRPEPIDAEDYLAARTIAPLRIRRHRVGIVEVHGAIIDDPPLGIGGRSAWARSVIQDLRAAGEDDSIGAVVVHVDSRGGSVTASDAIWAAIRRLDRDKPVVACLGDVAASGGYYVACGARSIVASPLTITGSIGVFALSIVLEQLGERYGLGHDRIKNRKHAGIHDPLRRRSDEAKAHLQREVEALYRLFLDLVQTSRQLSADQLAECAEGRVMTGTKALAHGLLDGLGGWAEALERARDAAGMRLTAEPTIVRAHRIHPRPPLATQAPYQGHFAGQALAAACGRRPLASTTAVVEELLAFLAREHRVCLAWAPIDLH